MKKLPIYILALFILFPKVVSAADTVTIQSIITALNSLVGLLVPIVIGIALLGFLWGLAMYIIKAGDEKAKEGGRNIMLWGIIILFVMVSIWGIVRVLQVAFGLTGTTSPTIPTVKEIPVPPGSGTGGSCDPVTGQCLTQ